MNGGHALSHAVGERGNEQDHQLPPHCKRGGQKGQEAPDHGSHQPEETRQAKENVTEKGKRNTASILCKTHSNDPVLSVSAL